MANNEIQFILYTMPDDEGKVQVVVKDETLWCTQIVKSANEMTFANPGDVRIGLKAALTGGVSDPRNVTIMKMFSLVDIGERAGSGIPDFINTWQTYIEFNPSYTVTHNPDRTKLAIPYTLEALQKAGEKLAKNMKDTTETTETTTETTAETTETTTETIFKLMKENPKITTKELASACGITEDGVAYHIKKLKTTGRVIRIGGKRNGGEWKVQLTPKSL